MAFVWLVSYPKSGNTWLRIMLTSYLSETQQPISLTDPLVGPQNHLGRHSFDETMGINSSELTSKELDGYRHKYHDLFVNRYPGNTFTKVHETYLSKFTRKPLFPARQDCRVIYLVRNPLDIVASYAHQERCTFDEMIIRLADENSSVQHGSISFPEHLGTWSNHVEQWTAQTDLKVNVVRYEDMIADTYKELTRILQFAGLPIEKDKLANAIENAGFDALQALERTQGFSEHPDPTFQFFRKGSAGGWKEELTEAQIDRVKKDHHPQMTMFGYT